MKTKVEQLKEENRRLHDFVLSVSQRLFLAAEVLSIKAEKKSKTNTPSPRSSPTPSAAPGDGPAAR